MSAFGPKRTCVAALHEFAFDPERTFPHSSVLGLLSNQAEIFSSKANLEKARLLHFGCPFQTSQPWMHPSISFPRFCGQEPTSLFFWSMMKSLYALARRTC